MDWNPYDPCPYCGAQNETTFRQVTTDHEQAFLDENGEPEYFEPVGDGFEVLAVACTECDTVVRGDAAHFPWAEEAEQ